MLLFQVLQDFSFLTLSGVGLYAIRSAHTLNQKPALKQLLIGLVFGSVFVLIATNTSRAPADSLHFDAGLGPLFFAGYLGGALGAFIVAAASLFVLMLAAFDVPLYSATLYLSVVVLGFLAHRLLKGTWDSDISRSAVFAGIGALVVGHALATIGHVLFYTDEPVPELLGCVVFGTIGLLASAAVIAMSDYVYATKTRAAELAYRLNMVTQTGRMGVFEFRKTAQWVNCDQGMMRLFKLNGEARDLPLPVWIERIHPLDQSKLMEAIKSVVVDGSDQDQIEFRGVMPDGSINEFQAHWVTEREPSGAFVRLVGVHVDMSEIRRSERDKSSAEQWLAAIASNLPGAVMVAEKKTGMAPRLVYVSDYCSEIWGHSNQEIIEDPELILSTLDPDEREAMIAELRAATHSLGKLQRRCKVTTKDGTVKWVDYHGSSVRIDDTCIRTDSIILDVTAEVLAQRQLREQSVLTTQAQKMESIGQLTGGVAHDFNNLLAVIIGNLELLGEDVEDKNHLQMINSGIGAALRGADLTRKMLAFARRSQLETQTIDLNEIVGETKNWAGRTLPATIKIETSLLEGVWPVEADRASTESALLNLILNARDSMPDGGKLTLETANVRIDQDYGGLGTEALEPGCYVMLAVSDTGSGIDAKVLAFVFEPFYTTKAPGAGSGLGLSMVQGFMHQSGGAVRVYSEPGVGTTFKLFFPVTDVQDIPEVVPFAGGAVQHTPGARILVAEDQSDVLEVLVQILTGAGYQVRATSSGDAAKAVFEADSGFDMLLTDIVMPGRLQGTMLAQELRKIRPDLPVVFMSGYANEATVHGNGLKPQDVRLMKPVQKRDLLAAIEGLLSAIARPK